MIDFIYSVPSFVLFIFVSLILLLFSYTSTGLVQRYISLKFRCDENEAVVAISAIIGVIYAILVGFTFLFELDSYNKADQSEKEEAKLVFASFRKALELPEPGATQIRKLLVAYVDNTIQVEWPKMVAGKPVGNSGTQLVMNMFMVLHNFTNLNPAQVQSLNSLSISINALFDQHEERVAHSHTVLNSSIWFVLFLGTLLTLSSCFILGMDPRLHYACITTVTLMIASVVFLMLTLDRPYRGDLSVKPETFQSTLEYINWHAMLKESDLR